MKGKTEVSRIEASCTACADPQNVWQRVHSPSNATNNALQARHEVAAADVEMADLQRRQNTSSKGAALNRPSARGSRTGRPLPKEAGDLIIRTGSIQSNA